MLNKNVAHKILAYGRMECMINLTLVLCSCDLYIDFYSTAAKTQLFDTLMEQIDHLPGMIEDYNHCLNVDTNTCMFSCYATNFRTCHSRI